MKSSFGDNLYYAEYEVLLKRLHRLIAEGKGDTADADDLRDEMDRAGKQLSYEEMAQLRGLSADLYMLQDDEIYSTPEPGENPSERTPERLRAALQDAWTRGDAAAALGLLRKGAAGLTRDQRAYLRASAYETLGHLDTALLFMDYAAEQEPKISSYRAGILNLLDRLERRDELLRRASEYVQDEASSTELRVYCAGVLFRLAQRMSPEQAAPLVELIVSRLESMLSSSADRSNLVSPDVRASGQLTLGFSYQRMGRSDEALNAFNETMRSSRLRGVALVARGMLLAESSPDQALSDFEDATKIGTSLVAPYLYLAHHALVHGDYARCLELCDQALDRTRSHRVRAVLLQWEAIAGFELDLPRDRIRRAFEVALEIDPLNPQIRHNFAVFQEREQTGANATLLQGQWQTPAAPEIEAADLLQPMLTVAA